MNVGNKLAVTLLAMSGALVGPVASAQQTSTVKIIAFNDFHGNLQSLATSSAFRRWRRCSGRLRREAQEPESIQRHRACRRYDGREPVDLGVLLQ